MHQNQNQETILGRMPTKTDKRDAIHVAVIPVTAAKEVNPGDRIYSSFSRLDGDFIGYPAYSRESGIAIVDPFLPPEPLKKGSRFWALVLPNTITGMTHHWNHPNFPDYTSYETDETKIKEAEKFIYVFAEELNIEFDEVLQAGDNYVEFGERYIVNYDTPEYVSDLSPSFWEAWSIIRKKTNSRK